MSNNNSTITADDIDFDFLPLIYQYLRGIEKEQNQTDLNRVALDATQKLTELNQKISLAREQVPKLAGVEYSPEDQLKRLDALRAKLSLKKQVLLKYKNKAAAETIC